MTEEWNKPDRIAALMRLIRSVIDKRGVIEQTQREAAVALVAAAALNDFPERAWERYGRCDEEFDTYVAIALLDLNHTGSFGNTRQFFQLDRALKLEFTDGRVSREAADDLERRLLEIVEKDPTHPLSKYYADWLPTLRDRSEYIMRVYAVGLAASAPVAALVEVVLIAVALKRGAAFAANSDVQDLISTIVSFTLFYPLAYLTRRVQTVRTPVVPPAYLPILLLLELLIFVEFRLAFEFFVAIHLNLPFKLTASFSSLLADARERWLYSAPFAVIGLSLLQQLRFIGRLVPEGLEDWDEAASAITAGVVAVIAVAVSAVIKLVLMIVR